MPEPEGISLPSAAAHTNLSVSFFFLTASHGHQAGTAALLLFAHQQLLPSSIKKEHNFWAMVR
jgi:hypothetical protein